MEKEWGQDLKQISSPRFASYAALQRGISQERGYVDWCRWVAKRLEEGAGGDDAGEGQDPGVGETRGEA